MIDSDLDYDDILQCLLFLAFKYFILIYLFWFAIESILILKGFLWVILNFTSW